MNNEVSTFLKKRNACREGFAWATKNCNTMQEVWDTAKPEWLIWLALRDGVLTDRELHEFGLFAANQVKHLMTDKRSIAALEAKRLWLDGKITDQELDAAQSAARSAAWSAESDARSAAWSAESDAWSAWSAARSAAQSDARSAAWSAWSAARSAAWSAESDAEQKQVDYLRKNCKPCFK